MKFAYASSPNCGGERSNSNSLWMFLVCCGLVGVCLTFLFGKDGKSAGNPDARIMYSSQPAQVADNSSLHVKEAPAPNGRLVRPDDWPEAHKTAIFTLLEASEGVVYHLELADGTRKTFVNNKLRHTFTKVGPTEVRLLASFEGQTKLLQTLPYRVAPAAEVESVANFVNL